MEPTMVLVAWIAVLFSVALYEFFVRDRLINACLESKVGRAASAYQRIGLAIVVGASFWILLNGFFIQGIPASRYIQPYADGVVLAVASMLGWIVWSRSRRAPSKLLAQALRGIVLVGGIAFVVSAISGPILFPTKINQGVLVGLFAIGPAFMILGGVGGLLVWSIRANSEPADS